MNNIKKILLILAGLIITIGFMFIFIYVFIFIVIVVLIYLIYKKIFKKKNINKTKDGRIIIDMKE